MKTTAITAMTSRCFRGETPEGNSLVPYAIKTLVMTCERWTRQVRERKRDTWLSMLELRFSKFHFILLSVSWLFPNVLAVWKRGSTEAETAKENIKFKTQIVYKYDYGLYSETFYIKNENENIGEYLKWEKRCSIIEWNCIIWYLMENTG